MTDHEDRQLVAVPRWMMHECDGDARDAMVLAQIAFWFQPPLDNSRQHRALHTVERDGATWVYLTDADLAEQLGMTRSQVQRARSALGKRGLVASRTAKVAGERRTLVRPVIAGKRGSAHRPAEPEGLCADPREGSTREVALSSASSDQSLDQKPLAADAAGEGVLFGEAPVVDPATERKARGRAVAERVWAEKSPRPAVPFIAVAKIAEALLDAGHEPDRIVWAMVEAPTITTRAVEFALNRNRSGRLTPVGAQPPPSEDRSGHTGRMRYDPAREEFVPDV